MSTDSPLLTRGASRGISRVVAAVTAAACVPIAALCLMVSAGAQAATPGAELSVTGKVDEAVSPETRSFLQLQEQLHATQLAVERNRKETTETAIQTTEALTSSMRATADLSSRLKTMEEALSGQRVRELDAMQSSNRTVLIVAGAFAGLGFVALFMMGYFQWRTVNRLAELSTALPGMGLSPMNPRPLAALTAGEAVSAPVPAQTGNADLIRTIERIEKRVLELEQGPVTHPTSGNGNGIEHDFAEATILTHHSAGNGQGEAAAAVVVDSKPAISEHAGRIMVLLGKGQSLLNVDKAEEALACFEEALALEAGNPEALVKKGAALERLRKLDEAIECYDRAIEADGTMTIAYLYKGGLCNRMERFNEALHCYEQALRTQEKRVA